VLFMATKISCPSVACGGFFGHCAVDIPTTWSQCV
jgi:hypothetical protein